MIGIGAGGCAGIIKEAGGYGTGGTVDTYLELISEDVKLNQEKIPSAAVFGKRYMNKYINGVHDVGGPFTIEVNPDNIGLLMYMALGVEASADQVVGTQAEVTDITCEADTAGSLSGEYITIDDPTTEYYAWFDVDDEGSIDPAVAGKTGIVVGITANDTATAVATALTAAINAETDFGATSAAAVVTVTNANTGAATDATNGDTGWSTSPDVTTQGSGGAAYDHVYTPADAATDLGSFIIEIDRGLGAGEAFTYDGMKVNTMTLNAAKGSLLTAVFDCFGQQEADGISPQTLNPSSLLPFTFSMGVLKVANQGGSPSPIAYCNSINLVLSNALDADGGFVFDGNDYRNHLNKQTLALTGSMELEYTSTSDVERDAYRDNQQRYLQLIFTSPDQIEAGYYYTMTWDIYAVHYLTGHPQISGRDRVPFSVDFEAVRDSSSGLCKCTLRDARTTKWSA